MKKPHRFYLMHNVTKEIKPFVSYRFEPIKSDVFAYVETSPGVKEYKEVFTVYEDLRYLAKLRLWKYLTYTKRGLEIPKYEPFKNTEIGKSIAILNF